MLTWQGRGWEVQTGDRQTGTWRDKSTRSTMTDARGIHQTTSPPPSPPRRRPELRARGRGIDGRTGTTVSICLYILSVSTRSYWMLRGCPDGCCYECCACEHSTRYASETAARPKLKPLCRLACSCVLASSSRMMRRPVWSVHPCLSIEDSSAKRMIGLDWIGEGDRMMSVEANERGFWPRHRKPSSGPGAPPAPPPCSSYYS
jgi:hypothetical protein